MSAEPPYQFELIDGGIFQPGSRYAILRRQSFSSLTILECVGRMVSPCIKNTRSYLNQTAAMYMFYRYQNGLDGHHAKDEDHL